MAKKSSGSIKRFRNHHKIIFSLVGLTGAVLIWRGIWLLFDQTPYLNNPLASLILGLALVAMSGAFFKLI